MASECFKILDREFRFGVPPENVSRLRDCSMELDERMRAIRNSGRVLGYDQIAVMVALDLIWERMDREEAVTESRKREEAAASRIDELREKLEAALGQNGTGEEQ